MVCPGRATPRISCPNAKKGPAATSADPFTEAPKLSDETPPTEGDPRITPGEAGSSGVDPMVCQETGKRTPFSVEGVLSGITVFEPASAV